MKKLLLFLIVSCVSTGMAFAQKTAVESSIKSYLESSKPAVGKSITVQEQADGKTASATVSEKESVIAYIRQQAEEGESKAAQKWEKVNVSMTKDFSEPIYPEKWIASRITPRKALSVKPQKAIDLNLKDYLSKDSSRYNGIVNVAMKLIYKDGGMKMTNVYGAADTVAVTIDTEAGTVSISPQQIGYATTYKSAVYIYAIDATKNVYSTTDPITGTIDADGVIKLSAWGVFIAEGDYKGAIYDAYNNSEWIPSNATLTNTDSDGNTSQYPSLIEQTYDNEIVIYNLAGNGKTVTATLTAAKTVKISPQYIHTNAFYGDFYCYPLDTTTNKVDDEKPILGTGTSTSISLGAWVVGLRSMPSTYALKVAKTEISTSLVIKYPESLTTNFAGSGTESSPYLIKTVADINALSQAVSGGETYTGKYFRLENDIDMSGQTSRFIPVGSVDAPFNATFDGNGKTISNLSFDLKGTLYVGLFGYLDSQATVKNLKISSSSISGTGKYYGFIAGYNKGVIDSCSVSGNIVVKSTTMGGIAGASENAIRNCTFMGNIKGYGALGGIVGICHGELSNCSAEAYINLNGYLSSQNNDAGGLVGALYPLSTTTATMSDSYFMGTIADTYGYGYTGGLVGMTVNAKVTRSFNTATVSSENNDSSGSDTGSGGLVGISSRSTFTDCYNAGAVLRGGDYDSESAGGLAGYLSVTYTTYPYFEVNNASTFTNCYNSGLVSSTSAETTKGLWGRTFVYKDNESPAKAMFVNSFFDKQTTGLDDEEFGKPTSFFTSGTLMSGFNSDTWTATANYYPLLKSVSDNTAAKLSAASFLLSNEELSVKVKSAFTLNAPDGISWKLYDGTNFVDETDALTISGSTVSIKDIYSSEILTALTTSGNARIYTLAVVPKVFDGEGTEASPYLIKTKDDFINLDKAVSEHKQPHTGDFFAMTNDIDFGLSDDFSGVSAGTGYPFGGSFDGKGYYIHNLKIHSAAYDDSGKGTATGSYYGAGLFSYLSEKGAIKNVNIAADCDFDFYGESGPVVGYTLGKVENCRNYAAVKSLYIYMGGIAGVADTGAKITGCYNAGDIQCGYAGVGGIAGYNRGTIELSQNDGNVTAAYLNDYKAAGQQTIAGGIVGTNYGDLDRNVNNGTVSSYSVIGGIAGSSSNYYKDVQIKGNINNGFVAELGTSNTRGGIIGQLTGTMAVAENNYFDASINVNGGVMNAETQGLTGLSSNSMTDGSILTGLSATDFDFTASKYPVLAAFKDELATVALRSIFMKFADGEKRTDMTHTVALSEGSSLVWTLKQNKEFNISNDSVTVTPPTDMIVAADTLTAVYDSTYTKVYYLSSIPQNLFEGKGTATLPYLLKTADDVNLLSSFMASSNMEFDGYYFKVANDIDFAQGEFSPIASGSVNFQGDFDGDGKTISNFVYEDENSKTGANAAFFGNVGGNGVVHNLTLNGKIHGYKNAAGFVSSLYGTLRDCVNKSAVSAKSTKVGGLVCTAYEGAVIERCTNEGTVNSVGSNYAAGIVVTMNEGSTADSCVNKGTVTAKSGSIGGIVSVCNGTVTNSHNEAVLGQVVNTVGGIAGTVAGNCRIENCYNTATITGKSQVSGVIAIGSDKSAVTIKSCYNTGDINGVGYVGGVIGKTGKGYTVEDCYNTGSVTATTSGGNGGLVGLMTASEEYPSSVKRCHNTGNVTSNAGTTAGLIGSLLSADATVEDCYNTGNVTVSGATKKLGVAGLIGGMSGSILRCWNGGDVTSTTYGTGGISGYASGTADSCFNVGNITSTDITSTKYGRAGGIWGYGNAKIYNCYNMGTITAPTLAAGINGSSFNSSVIENSYNAGKIVTSDEDAQWANTVIVGDSYLASVTMVNNYYDAEINAVTNYDNAIGAYGKTTAEMFDAKISDAFLNTRAAYPTLSVFADNSWANFAAASVAFTGDDNAQNVTDKFFVGTFDNVSWTASSNIALTDDGTAEPLLTGEAWVKVTASFSDHQLEKTFVLNITKATSDISTLTEGKNCISRTFFDLSGVAVEKPMTGKIYIVTELYDDGTRSTQKVLYNK